LKDVADIEFGSSMYDIYSTLNGKPSAAITVKQSYGSNASDVIKNVKALMADLEKIPSLKECITISVMTFPDSWMHLWKK
jgi:multidrug efflux pump subunit AcrB